MPASGRWSSTIRVNQSIHLTTQLIQIITPPPPQQKHTGQLPRAVHIHVHRIPAADLPRQQQQQDGGGQQCEAFLAQSFECKEAMLRRFYAEGIPLGQEEKQPQQEKQKQSRGYARAARRAYAQGLLVMALTAAGVVALGRWLSPLVFWGYVVGVLGTTVLVIHRLEGWDSLELRLVGEGDGVDGEKKGKAA